MKFRVAAIAASVFAFALLIPIGSRADQRDDLAKLRQQLRETEIQREKLRMFLPPTDADGTREFVEKVARKADLETDSIGCSQPERVRLANGNSAPLEVLHLDVNGRDDFEDVVRFLRWIDIGARPILVESLHMSAEADGRARYEIRFAAGSWAPVEPAPAVRGDIVQDVRRRLDDERQLLELLTRIVGTRNSTRLAATLAAFTRAAENHAITVSDVRFSDRLTIEGIATGAAARSALRDAVASAKVTAVTVEMPKGGVCRAFTIRGELSEPADADEIGTGSGVFDPLDLSRCTGGSAATRSTIAVHGSNANGMRLKLRGVDASDLVLALHDMTGEGFVVDADVDARVDVDVESATLDETIAAMKSAGLAVGPGPLHRVSRGSAAHAATSDQKFSGNPVSVALRHADVRDVLCLFSQISGLEIDVPPGVEKKVTIFAKNTEWDRALEGFITAAGMRYTISGHRVLLGADEIAATGLVDSCESGAATHPNPFGTFRIENLGASDLKLAGIARLKDGWEAYVVAPGGSVLPLASGQKLFDSSAKLVDASGVTLETASGELRVKFEE